jgi:hypothetical protein
MLPPTMMMAPTEFRRVAQLLGLNAKLVAAAGIELGQRSAFLAGLAPAARQLLGGKKLQSGGPPVADEIVPWLGP